VGGNGITCGAQQHCCCGCAGTACAICP
jgi:hypothetical protein